MTGPRAVGRMLAWGALGLLGGCASAPEPSGSAGAAPADLACAAEAERLVEPVVVHAAPDPGIAPLVELEAGRFVYRCARRGDWLAIMFPAGGEPVDCTVRPAGQACATGWVRGEPETAIFG